MERLTPADAAFVHLEDDISAVHSLTVGIFEGPEPSFDDLQDRVAERIGLIPRYRQRLVGVPFGLERPVWVDDPHFSLDFHVRHTALPSRRSADALSALMSRLLSQRIDRGKPLWELWMVSGLDEGRFAIVSKVHYALIDGVSGTDIFGLLFDDLPAGAVPVEWSPEPIPSGARLAGRALSDVLFDPVERVRAVRRTVTRPVGLASRAVRSLTAGDVVDDRGLSGPIGPHRRWQRTRLSLDHLRRIRAAQECTTNDVLLAAISGGFRAHLLAEGIEIPKRITTLVPLAVASAGTDFHNEVTALRTRLPLGISDPVAQLRAIRAQTAVGAAHQGAVAGESLRRIEHFAAPTLFTLGLRAATRVIHRGGIDTVTVNVPGPAHTQALLGHELTEAYPVIPLAENIRIGVAAMSYRDDLFLGITGDWDTVPDLTAMVEGIETTVARLLELSADGPLEADQAS